MRFVDLFCGMGGASCGAQSEGMDVALAVDSDPEALAVHRLNHPNCNHVCVTLPCSIPLPKGPIHIHASPPCQAVSQANRSISRARRQSALRLLKWTIEFCRRHGTTWSLEQVNAVDVCDLLHNMGVEFDVFNFHQLGVAQTRKRVLAGSPQIVEALRAEVDTHGKSLCVSDVIPRCRGAYIRNGTTSTWKVKQGVRTQIPLTEDHPSFARHVSQPAYTVTGNSPLRWYSPKGCAMFSPLELAMLQGFPADYKLHENRKLAYQHVGNAIPPPIASRIVARCPVNFPPRKQKEGKTRRDDHVARRSRGISRRRRT